MSNLTRIKLIFHLSSPIIVLNPLYLDAILLNLAQQSGQDYRQVKLPIHQDQGIYRCSHLIWDGEPQRADAKKILNIWRSQEIDAKAQTTAAPFLKSHFKKYKTIADKFPTMNLPFGYFIVETPDPTRLLALAKEIPALGKWSRKGYGQVSAVDFEQTDTDPWQSPHGHPTRALPLELWKSRYQGRYALMMSMTEAPYWETERAQICAVDPIYA